MMHSKAITYQSVDESLDCAYWEQIWVQDWDAREQMYVGQAHLDYWQARAEDFSAGRKACDFDFGRKVLQILEPLLPAKARVLDVGCGPGSLLIPFCQAGLEVTAVEPAREMIKQLNTNAFSDDVHNYSVQAKPWQEVDLDILAKGFDLAISAITMWMFRDLRNQLERLEKASKNLCCVVGGAGGNPSGHTSDLWQAIMGDLSLPSYSEFPLVFNLLYAMGRYPQVRIIDYQTERTLESKIRQQNLFYAKYINLTPEIKSLIKSKIKATGQDGLIRENCKASVVFWQAPAY